MTSASASKVHHFKPRADHVRPSQPPAVPSYTVPGWTEEQTRNWMDSYHEETD